MLPWGKILGEAGAVILCALLLTGAALVIRPDLRPMLVNPMPAGYQSEQPSEAAVRFLSLEDARSDFRKGDALFADARPERAYRAGHIPGALNLDPNEFDTWSGSFFSQFPEDTRVITYCDGDLCPLSSELAQKLIQLGYENVYVLKNGWSLWTAAQLPTERVAE